MERISAARDADSHSVSVYDRQIRLWGAEGQDRLADATVCMLGASTVATETLKSIILPGIRHFAIVDNESVQKSDIGLNYFLDARDEGRNRATAVLPHLLELNPAVTGTAITRSPITLVEECYRRLLVTNDVPTAVGIECLEMSKTLYNQSSGSDESSGFNSSCIIQGAPAPAPTPATASIIPEAKKLKHAASSMTMDDYALFFKNFSLTICAGLPLAIVLKLGTIMALLKRPLIVLNSIGMFGLVRIYCDEHLVLRQDFTGFVNSHDLFIAAPFQELLDYTSTFDKLDSLSDTEHAQVPYIAILILVLKEFREIYNHIPQTAEEKEHFKLMIKGKRRNEMEQNFTEAIDNAYRAYAVHYIPETVQAVFNESRVRLNEEWVIWVEEYLGNTNSIRHIEEFLEKAKFWIVCNGLANFVKQFIRLPAQPDLPDLASSTSNYISLKNVYQKQFERDVGVIKLSVQSIVQSLHKKMNALGYADIRIAIPDDYIILLTKNLMHLQVQRFKSLSEEYSSNGVNHLLWSEELKNKESLLPWYITLWALERFREKYIMGHYYQSFHYDSNKLGLEVKQLLAEVSIAAEVDKKIIEHFAYFKNCELHTTSAFVAGVAAQEAVKILCNQFIVLNNTFLWDGANGRGQSFKF